MTSGNAGLAGLRTIVVLHNPDQSDLASLKALNAECYAPLAVCNAMGEAERAELETIGIESVFNDGNVGLATALNVGMRHAFAKGADYALLLDQDSRPDAMLARSLLAHARDWEEAGGKLGCIGPTTVEAKTLRRDTPALVGPALVTEKAIITSGSIVSRAAFETIGPMWDELFIDYIDHEWCFRASAQGYAVFVARDVLMPHNLGDAAIRIGSRTILGHRSPFRHYHLVRNAFWVFRCSYIPLGWRLGEMAMLLGRIPKFLAISSDRTASLSAILRGIAHGLRGPRTRPATLGHRSASGEG